MTEQGATAEIVYGTYEGETVVLKRYRGELCFEAADTEAGTLAMLYDSGIAPKLIEYDGTTIVTTSVNGPLLSDLLLQVSTQRALSLGVQALNALMVMKLNGLSHGAFTTRNMAAVNDTVVLLEFGASHEWSHASEEADVQSLLADFATLRRTGNLLYGYQIDSVKTIRGAQQLLTKLILKEGAQN